MQLKLQKYYQEHPQRYKAKLYLDHVRDDRRARLRAEAQYLSCSYGLAALALDGMPKQKGAKHDPVGDAVAKRKEVVLEYTKALIYEARSYSELRMLCNRAGISNFICELLIDRFVKEKPIKNIQMTLMMERTKLNRLINDGLDKLYEVLEDKWK